MHGPGMHEPCLPWLCGAAKARTEAEEAQRILLAALNGLGGLLVLQGLTTEAVAAYREALAQGMCQLHGENVCLHAQAAAKHTLWMKASQ